MIRRRTAIDKRTNYRKYLPELREDFQYICGYCGKPESITKNAFEIDHFVPRKYDKTRANDYTNLVYSCCICNRKKSSKWPSEDGKIQFSGEKGFVDPAMEDYVIDIMIGKGPGARSVRLDLPKFTLIGATTRIGLLTAPLRDRFGVVHRLEPYGVAQLKVILLRSADVLKVELDEDGAEEIARRSRGTPRIANRLLKRVRDFAQVKYDGKITGEVARFALDLLEVDKMGLDYIDRKMLMAMIDKFGGKPVGLDTLAASINEESETIEDVYEPYLLQLGYIQRTPRGRVVTKRGYDHFGLTYPEGKE